MLLGQLSVLRLHAQVCSDVKVKRSERNNHCFPSDCSRLLQKNEFNVLRNAAASAGGVQGMRKVIIEPWNKAETYQQITFVICW